MLFFKKQTIIDKVQNEYFIAFNKADNRAYVYENDSDVKKCILNDPVYTTYPLIAGLNHSIKHKSDITIFKDSPSEEEVAKIITEYLGKHGYDTNKILYL